VFNYHDHFLETCITGCPVPGNWHEQAKLNAKIAEDPTHMINGIIYEVDVDDLVRLRPRERGYDLERIYVIDYADALDCECCRPQIRETYFRRAIIGLSLGGYTMDRTDSILPALLALVGESFGKGLDESSCNHQSSS
jgi:hypothetical protein